MIKFLNLFRICNGGNLLSQQLPGFGGRIRFISKFTAFYWQYALLCNARELFDELPPKNLYQWNKVLKCYNGDGKWKETLLIFRKILSSGTSVYKKPDSFTLPAVLKACGKLREARYGNMVHGFVKKSRKIGLDVFVGSALIEMYFKFGYTVDASKVFEEFNEPDVVMWTSMISGYEQNGHPQKAVQFFVKMATARNVEIDPATLIALVSACKHLSSSIIGKSLHCFIIRKGLDFDVCLLNSLLDLYAKTGVLRTADNLFRTIANKDIVSWSAMISCYASNGCVDEILSAFNEMMEAGIEPNPVTIVNALQAFSSSVDLKAGERIHELARERGLEADVTVATALVGMYMKCCSPDRALDVFSRMPEKDMISWNSLISGFAQNGMAHKAMEIIRNMLVNETQPDVMIMVKVLSSCSELGMFAQAVCLHGYVIRRGFDNNPFVGASLIELYSKCGCVDKALRVFRSIETKDAVVWSSMIAGYGLNGQGHAAISIYNHMLKHTQTKPNNITFLSILSACSHAGLVQNGIEIFNSMTKDHNLVPDTEHYAIMVDILGRTGDVQRAVDFINQMPIMPGCHIWGALLGACRIHQNIEVAKMATKNLLHLSSTHAGYYILLSNIYGLEGEWLNMEKVRNFVKEKRMKKVLGESNVEIEGKWQSFVADDSLHIDCKAIHEICGELGMQMKEEVLLP